jgi:hypothetical protein
MTPGERAKVDKARSDVDESRPTTPTVRGKMGRDSRSNYFRGILQRTLREVGVNLTFSKWRYLSGNGPGPESKDTDLIFLSA